jgi:hypothetical protein
MRWYWKALPLLALPLGCEEPPAKAPVQAGPEREVVLKSPQHRAPFDRARENVRWMKGLFGKVMTPELVTELGFRCADMRGDARLLEAEDDPIVQRARADVELLCRLEVPVASARMEIERIETKRRENPGANVKRECTGLRLALGDIGPQYASNPMMADLAGKFASLCPPE